MIKVYYKVRYRNFRGRLSGVVFITISLLFDKILKLSLMPAAVKDLFHFLLLFFINKNKQGVFF